MFFQESIPDTSRYMVLGYSITFVVMALYVFSLHIRHRNLNQDKAMLEEMDKAVPQPAPARKQKSASKTSNKKTKK